MAECKNPFGSKMRYFWSSNGEQPGLNVFNCWVAFEDCRCDQHKGYNKFVSGPTKSLFGQLYLAGSSRYLSTIERVKNAAMVTYWLANDLCGEETALKAFDNMTAALEREITADAF